MISEYIDEALYRADYSVVGRNACCATVAGLPGVIAAERSLEACRDQLPEVEVGPGLSAKAHRGAQAPRLAEAWRRRPDLNRRMEVLQAPTRSR